MAGEAADVPTAVLMHSLSPLPEPGKPPPGFGFLPARSALGRARDRFFERIYLRVFNTGLPGLNEARRACGLQPLGHVLEHVDRANRLLCLYSEAFDLPAELHPANFRYVGPVLEEPAWTEPWTSPWSADDRRPLVVVSLSTTFMGQERVVERCIDAVASMAVRALVTVGPTLDPSAFRGGENVVVVRSAPHDEVFGQASAVITHAGMGTVARALAHGVPLVCIPMGRDQDDNAARVRWHGAGLRVRRNRSPARIRAALHRVLNERSFREAADRLRQAMQADVAAGRAVAELEALAAVSDPRKPIPSGPSRRLVRPTVP